MCQPKYSAGEIAVLHSKMRPDLNGECTVITYVEQGQEYFDHVAGEMVLRSGNSGYILDIADAVTITTQGTPCAMCFKESALRKRHEPGEYSFEGLKQILSMPIDRMDFA